MSLSESQQFFFALCTKPQLIKEFRKNRAKVLRKYFASPTDRDYLATYPAERFQTYRDHVSEGLLGGVKDAFPISYSLMPRAEWNELLNSFYLKHLTGSPLARHVYREFGLALQDYRGPASKKYPFLKELARYEYLDIKLYFALDQKLNIEWQKEAPRDPLTLVPILNPVLELETYHWPVHQIVKRNAKRMIQEKGHYPLLVYRHPETLELHFMESNVVLADLVGAIKAGRKNIGQILSILAKRHRIKAAQQESFWQEGLRTLADLRQRGVVIGYQ